jgi:hypothetical protein
MNSKAFLYLLLTLLIGIGLGMITHRAFLINRKPRMDRLPPERNIINDIVRTLELSPGQVDSIMPVLEDFYRRAEITRARVMQQADADLDTLRLSLLPYLTESQQKKMEDLGLFYPGPQRPGGPPGPPPGGPPFPPDRDRYAPGRQGPGDPPPPQPDPPPIR